jgi:hypothetical protein
MLYPQKREADLEITWKDTTWGAGWGGGWPRLSFSAGFVLNSGPLVVSQSALFLSMAFGHTFGSREIEWERAEVSQDFGQAPVGLMLLEFFCVL